MIGDLTREEWLSIIKIPEERIPKVLITCGTRDFKGRYERYRQSFEDVIENPFRSTGITDSLIGNLNGIPAAYCSVYSSPMASEAVHLCGVLGTKAVIHTGSCGALDPIIRIGDLFTAQRAWCGEGVSCYYGREKWIDALPGPDEIPDEYGGRKVRKGSIYTTSALFAERGEDIRKWYEMGCIAVDMETSAVFSVADYFNMKRASILFVYDNPADGDHIYRQNLDLRAERIKAKDAMTALVEEWAVKLAMTQ